VRDEGVVAACRSTLPLRNTAGSLRVARAEALSIAFDATTALTGATARAAGFASATSAPAARAVS
jgi:hypothetical protein